MCNTGFVKAAVRWQDEYRNNENRIGGQIPDGVYTQGRGTTIIEYCCRTDGYATNAIILPTDSPFALVKSNTHLCQKVKGMHVRSEFFFWDSDDYYIMQSKVTGPINAERIGKIEGDIKVHYCYYYN